jgi:hypothetical protein
VRAMVRVKRGSPGSSLVLASGSNAAPGAEVRSEVRHAALCGISRLASSEPVDSLTLYTCWPATLGSAGCSETRRHTRELS